MLNENVYVGLNTLVKEGRKHPDMMFQKLDAMQNIYLQKNSRYYSQDEQQTIIYYLNASKYKFQLSNLSLEQLWSISDYTKMKVVDAISNSLDELDISANEKLLISFTFESFHFFSKSFLDFYLLYTCLILRTGHEGSMTKEKFYKEMRKKSDEPFHAKSIEIKAYFNNNVFVDPNHASISSKNWGSFLSDIRNKVAHRDRIRPSFNSNEKLIGDVLFNWPTIQDMTFDRFCQDIQNGMFSLIQDTSQILFDLEWKSGPFKKGMWK